MSEKREFRIGDAVRIIGDGCNFTEHLDGEVGIIINTGFSSNNWMVQVGDCTWFIYDDHMELVGLDCKEYTFVTTVQLTTITKVPDSFDPYDRDTIAKNVKEYLEECTKVFDNIQVISVQQFEMELPNED